jgi:hypothetical protein
MSGRERSGNIFRGHCIFIFRGQSVFTRRFWKQLLTAASICSVLALVAGDARATVMQANIDQVFSGTATPVGNQPWLTAMFDDTGLPAGQVKVTLTVSGLVAPEKVDGWYINVGPDSEQTPGAINPIDPTSLTFSAPTKVGIFDDPTINLGNNAFKADGDGLYDIRFDFSTSNGHDFGAGDSVSYIVTGPASMNADSFTYLSKPAGGVGPYYEAAHILSIGQGGNSVWASPTTGPGNPVPEPAAIVLGLVGGCAMLGARYWKRAG